MTQLKIRLAKKKIKGLYSDKHLTENSQIKFQNDQNNNTRLSPLNATREVVTLKNKIKILENELQQSREEAFEAGIIEGKKIVEKNAEQKINQISAEFKNTTLNLEKKFRESIDNFNKPIVKLAGTIAKKILERELKYEDDYNEFLIEQINHYISELSQKNQLTIYISPEQFEWISSPETMDKIKLSAKTNLELIKDHSLKPGECLLETEELILEGVLDKHLKKIETQLILK